MSVVAGPRLGRVILARDEPPPRGSGGPVSAARARGFAAKPHHPPGAPVVPPGWGGDGGEDDVDPDGSTRRALEVAIDRAGLFRSIERAQRDGGDGASSSSTHAHRHLEGLEAHLASIIRFGEGP